MRTLLVTGSDTGVGKTRVTAALARLLADEGARVQIVKVVETGRTAGEAGDAHVARTLAGGVGDIFTLATFPAALAPASAAALAGAELSLEALTRAIAALPDCDWRICEGAGGVATPIDATGRDWCDFAAAIDVDAMVVVVPDRLGAINQARLAHARASQAGAPCGIWLNALAAVEPLVARSTRDGLKAAGVPLWAEQSLDAAMPADPRGVQTVLREATSRHRDTAGNGPIAERCRAELSDRDARQLRREVRVTPRDPSILSLADNDYLDLATDSAIAQTVADAASRYGTSASASPLITGWREPHARLLERLLAWHDFPTGMLWTSGYAANSAVLGGLPRRGDLALADRLVHHSMIAGLLRSGARLQRYDHLNLERLEAQLRAAGTDRQVFVVTETVFSMDGDYPDLARFADLKRRHGFFWIVDEAHALGWYGPEGAGLVRAAHVMAEADVLVGTLGKTLASAGAYTLFRDAAVRDYLINTAGEFIYSTAMPPTAAAAALAAIERTSALSVEQPKWHALSRDFRARLRQDGWDVPTGESPIVPLLVGEANRALSLAGALRQAGIIVGAVRPPTVPAGTSRLRFSLKRTLSEPDLERVFAILNTRKVAA